MKEKFFALVTLTGVFLCLFFGFSFGTAYACDGVPAFDEIGINVQGDGSACYNAVTSCLSAPTTYNLAQTENCNIAQTAINNPAQSRRYNPTPWNVQISIRYGEKTWHYNMADNISNLSSNSVNSRGIYRSIREKKSVISALASSGYTLPQSVCYILPNFSSLVAQIMSQVDTPPTNATAQFNNGKFTYTADLLGVKANTDELYRLIYENLSEKQTINLPIITLTADLTLPQLRDKTQLRGQFTTAYNSANTTRSNNITLALRQFNNMRVKKGETVSFNQVTGARTRDKGYGEAKIIVDGKYVNGVGGGVCQASTTLYNALLNSYVSVTRRHPHSLTAGYVAPSFDAAVSGTALDLVFVNQTECDLFIFAEAKNGKATVKIFGGNNPYNVKRISKVIKVLPCKTRVLTDTKGEYSDKVTYEHEQHVISQGKDGLTSSATLQYYQNGSLALEKFLHADTYKSVDRVIVKGAKPYTAPLVDNQPTNVPFIDNYSPSENNEPILIDNEPHILAPQPLIAKKV